MFFYFDVHVAHLVDLADRQSGGSRNPDNQVRIFILWSRCRGGDRSQRRRRERRRGNAAFIAETFRDQWAELIYRLTRVRSLGHEHDFVSLRSLQRHQGRDAAGVGRAVAKLKPDLALERLGNAR